MSSNIRINKICDYCSQKYIAKKTTTRYCSHKCNQRHYKQRKREEKIKATIQVEEKKVIKKKEAQTKELQVKVYLSVKEAALLLGVSERTFYRLMKNEIIKKHKLGGRTIIKRSDIDNIFS